MAHKNHASLSPSPNLKYTLSPMYANKLKRKEKKKLTISTCLGALHRIFETKCCISSSLLARNWTSSAAVSNFRPRFRVEIFTSSSSTISFPHNFFTGALFRTHFESKCFLRALYFVFPPLLFPPFKNHRDGI